VHSYSKDGAMRVQKVADPVYAPNSKGGPAADVARSGAVPSWYADGDITRAAYVDHAEDDDWGQAGTLVRDVLDDAARDRLVDNVVGHLLNGVTEPVLERAFDYWRHIDKLVGERIEAGVRAKADEKDPKAGQQGNPARTGMQQKA
jgi:catalase